MLSPAQKTASLKGDRNRSAICFVESPTKLLSCERAIKEIQNFEDIEQIYEMQYADRPLVPDPWDPKRALPTAVFRLFLRKAVYMAGIREPHTKLPYSIRKGVSNYLWMNDTPHMLAKSMMRWRYVSSADGLYHRYKTL